MKTKRSHVRLQAWAIFKKMFCYHTGALTGDLPEAELVAILATEIYLPLPLNCCQVNDALLYSGSISLVKCGARQTPRTPLSSPAGGPIVITMELKLFHSTPLLPLQWHRGRRHVRGHQAAACCHRLTPSRLQNSSTLWQSSTANWNCCLYYAISWR